MSDIEIAVLRSQRPADAALSLVMMPRAQLMALAEKLSLRLAYTLTNAQIAERIAAALHPPASGGAAEHAPYLQERML